MESSYLIQRLLKPYPVKEGSILKDNPFAFGGGLMNGGLSNDAMDLLRPIFRFDYMGSAEFEFGEVPKTLSKIAENRDKYIAFEFLVKYKYDSWFKKRQTVEGKKSVYVICQAEWVDEVKSVICHHANNARRKGDKYFTKEAVFLDRSLALLEGDDWAKDYQGWLELDNGYFFFSNKEMFDKVCTLFEIKKEQ
jgi:hypothetical protein